MALKKQSPLSSLSPTLAVVDDETLSRLRNVTLFESIKNNDEALRILGDFMHEVDFDADKEIIREGEQGSELYILLEGEVSIFKETLQGDKYKVVDLSGSKGVFFGEGALLDSEARSATICAKTSCKTLVLGRSEFEKFCKDHPEWANPIILVIARLVNGRLRKTNQDLLLLYNALVGEISGR